MPSVRWAAAWLALWAAAAVECGPPKVAGPVANVAVATGVGATRYAAGDCGDEPDASAAECFRGPQPQTDEGAVHLPGEPSDAGLDVGLVSDPDANTSAAAPDAGTGSPAAAATAVVEPARCRKPSSGVRRLRSWAGARVRDQYEVLLEHTSDWVPVDRIEMARHHATRLELENPAAHAALGQTAEPVRAKLELLERDIQHDTGRGIWLVTWRARVLDACVTPTR